MDTTAQPKDVLEQPVRAPETIEAALPNGPDEGIALCLSGGGYRAMIFHLGTLWRLNEAGLLGKLARVSSVSGGSIVAGVLGMNWNKLEFDAATGVAGAFYEQVIAPTRALADRTIDAQSVLGGLFLPGSISDKIKEAYRKFVFGDHTLQDLPDVPSFVINATNIQTGALWRFEKKYMGDYRVGLAHNPTVSLAAAVGASSAFPPVLSPASFDFHNYKFEATPGADLSQPPYTTDVQLADGGVYDNLGLETAWKRYTTILVSDGGGKDGPEPEPAHDWARHSIRILSIIDNQVRSLRKRQVVDSYKSNARAGAYWGIRTDISKYQLPDALPCDLKRTMELAATPTRLQRMDPQLQQRLINWGYAVCDAALRKHCAAKLEAAPYNVNPAQLAAGHFPYPGGV